MAIFAVCSAKNMAVESHLENVARNVRKVVIMDSNCCGFAGAWRFFLELNEHGLRDLKRQSEGAITVMPPAAPVK